MPQEQVKDKKGNRIEVGDKVFTKFRGGKREGEVKEIVTTKEEADEMHVLFEDQHGHHVAHNPQTLDDLSKEK
ncbi:MAG: hypothetical protein M1839_002846 [Geoglossum umbratile]|nr:MAG: hypothetical protein M1839_002846 [Geoglossum umbratile]